MAKNAAKKRRSGRKKVTRKQKNMFKYKPRFTSNVVKEMWDNNLTAEANMAKMGLRQDANSDFRPPTAAKVVSDRSTTSGDKLAQDCDVARLFGVMDTDDLRVVDRNPGPRTMSHQNQRYAAKLMARYGMDHEAMARDIKINYNQLTLGKLQRMCNLLLALGDDQRVVDIPQRVLEKASLASGDGARVENNEDAPVAMEEGEDEEGPQEGVAEISKKSKMKGGKKKEKKRRLSQGSKIKRSGRLSDG